MSDPIAPALNLQMTEPVPARVRDHGTVHHGEATWLESGKAHVVLPERLRPGHECGLSLGLHKHRVALMAKVLVARVLPDQDGHPAILHICSVVVPQGAHRAYQQLLQAVNPRTAELDPVSESGARRRSRTHRIPRQQEDVKRSRRRLPPARAIPARIPRSDEAEVPDRRSQVRPKSVRGLQPDELARVRQDPQYPERVQVAFPDAEHWLRSAQWSHGWLQLILADTFDQVPPVLDLTLTLPTGDCCVLKARVARRGRDRIVVEARSLSPAAHSALERACRPEPGLLSG